MELTIGEKIRNLREDCNLTQSALGKALNMTQRKISYIEKNQYEPSIDDIREICKFFRVSADYLIGLTNSPERKK
jgi:transcriptional regulator with XRE-family HTH domain